MWFYSLVTLSDEGPPVPLLVGVLTPDVNTVASPESMGGLRPVLTGY
jgi:hypothetical protein